VSGRPFSNQPRSRRAAKRFRHRRNRLARQLLDEAYAQFLSGLSSSINNNNSNSNNNSNINSSDNHNRELCNNIVPASPSPPPPPPPSQSPPLSSPPSPFRSFTPPIIEPDSPHSVLTQRIFPDSPPPSIRSFSPPSYSPVSSPEELPRPPSPSNSTSSVEFIDELYIPPPRPRYYYRYDPNESLENLITQFPQRVTPIPPGSYFIGPNNIDLVQVRTAITGQDPDIVVPVFLPTSPLPYNVPVRFFFNLFPPSTIAINELPN